MWSGSLLSNFNTSFPETVLDSPWVPKLLLIQPEQVQSDPAILLSLSKTVFIKIGSGTGGSGGSSTVISLINVSERPLLSEAVRETLYVPSLAYLFVGS